MSKRYLGDGVYADFDPQRGIVLTTEDGVSVTNTIVLETEVYIALERFAETFFFRAKAVRP